MRCLSLKHELSFLTLILLALLGAPRVILHDLHIIEEGTLVNLFFVFIPPMIWLFIILRTSPSLFKPLFQIGLIYGVILALIHQLLWNIGFETPPQLEGPLSALPTVVQNSLMRFAAFLSSIATGVAIGLIMGGAGWTIGQIKNRSVPQ